MTNSDRVLIPPPEGHGRLAAGFTAGFGLVVIVVAACIGLVFGPAIGGGMGWVIVGFAFWPFPLVGGGLIALGWHFWRLRNEPLVIEPPGRVVYRGRDVFEAVRGLIVRHRVLHGESETEDIYDLHAELPDGREAEFPSPYFSNFATRAAAAATASRIGTVLGVGVAWASNDENAGR
jgi:hypothetical protein